MNSNYCYIGTLLFQVSKSGSSKVTFPVKFNTCFTIVTAGANPTISWTNEYFYFNDMNFGTSSKPRSIPWLAIGY